MDAYNPVKLLLLDAHLDSNGKALQSANKLNYFAQLITRELASLQCTHVHIHYIDRTSTGHNMKYAVSSWTCKTDLHYLSTVRTNHVYTNDSVCLSIHQDLHEAPAFVAGEGVLHGPVSKFNFISQTANRSIDSAALLHMIAQLETQTIQPAIWEVKD